MSKSSHVRFLRNTLSPVALDVTSMQQHRDKLRSAVLEAVEIIETQRKKILAIDDSIYVGATGTALMYLRLIQQKDALNLSEEQVEVCIKRARAFLATNHASPRALRPGHISPLDSPVGVAVIRVILGLYHPSPSKGIQIQEVDINTLEQATQIAKQDTTGTNEVLYGRAGLLYALCQLREALSKSKTVDDRLDRLTSDETLKTLCEAIIREGKEFAEESGIPLYFEWHGTCYIGAIHGIAGIVTVLLQCPPHIIEEHRDVIIKSIKRLSTLVHQSCGHLPSSLPARHRSEPLAQICHGPPGYLLLLGTSGRLYPDWMREIEEDTETSLRAASDVIWEQGLLYKGLGICDGVTGNAWPWLLMASLNGPDCDEALSRALAFVHHATELPPMPPQTRHIELQTIHSRSLKG